MFDTTKPENYASRTIYAIGPDIETILGGIDLFRTSWNTSIDAEQAMWAKMLEDGAILKQEFDQAQFYRINITVERVK